MSLSELLARKGLASAEIRVKTSRIHQGLLAQSKYLRCGNFDAIHARDLEAMLAAYDSEFFERELKRSLGNSPMRFRLSRRLTSAAGQLTRRSVRPKMLAESDSAIQLKSPAEYEITISTTILFQSFLDTPRAIKASGLLCQDRLEALQRVFEHELIHLAEMLVWSNSRCTGERFQTIANRLFGHTEHTHQLITPREHAWTRFGLKVGDRVQFHMDGEHYFGKVNRITRRATVLVEDPQGTPYTNGLRYRKFYVPLKLLEPLAASDHSP